MAYQFAKNGLEKDSGNLQFRPIPMDYYHHLSKSIGNQWQKLWDEETSGRHMHTLCPGVKSYSKIRRRKRRDEVILTRLRLGHCGLNAYRSVVDKEVSAVCGDCGSQMPETVEHFLIVCPAHDNHRHSLNNAVLEKESTFSISTVLGPNLLHGPIQRAILDFITACGKYDTL